MLGFLPTRAYRPGTPGATTFLSPLSGTFNYGWDSFGLQVRSGSRWLDAPPLPNSFVCNIGDMLDRMTGGLYRSTPHRVRNTSKRGRLSFPFFFDPSFDARVEAIDLAGASPPDDRTERWDGSSVHEFEGTYGDYVLAKVSKVFPELRRGHL